MSRSLVHERSGLALVRDLEVADTFFTRALGLMGRARLAEGHGLLLVSCQDVHTCFMRFPIDVVYLDPELCVTKIVPELKPWRFSVGRGAHAVVELPAGTARSFGLTVGDRLALVSGGETSGDQSLRREIPRAPGEERTPEAGRGG